MSKARVALAIATGLTALGALAGIGKAKAASKAKTPAKPVTPAKPAPATPATPATPSEGMVLNATTFLQERIGSIALSENQRSRLVNDFNNLGVQDDGTVRIRPQPWAVQEALDLADQFDKEGANPDIAAAVRDFTLASQKLPESVS